MKKFIAIILTVAMVLCVMPVSFADTQGEYKVIENNSSFSINESGKTQVRLPIEKAGFYKMLVKSSTSTYNNVTMSTKERSWTLLNNQYKELIAYTDNPNELIMEFEPAGSGNHSIYIEAMWLSTKTMTLNRSTYCDQNVYYTFTPTTDGLYYIEDTYHHTDVKVSAPYEDNISYLGYFIGKANVPYVFVLTGLSSYVKISSANKTDFVLDTPLTTEYNNLRVEAFALNVAEEGYYKLDAKITNTELHVFLNNRWVDTAGKQECCVFYLKEGVFPVIAYYKQQRDGMLSPKVDMTFKKVENNAQPSIKVDGVFMTPAGSIKARYRVTAPVGTQAYCGFEYYVDDYLTNTSEFVDMTYSDKRCYEGYVSWGMEYNKTYTIWPYITIDGEKIYGEEQTVTIGLTPEIPKIEHSPYIAEIRDDNEYNTGRYYYFSFVQPLDATGKTTMSVGGSAFEVGVYDSNFNPVQGQYGYGYETVDFELTPGETYYISTYQAGCYDVDIVISSLPEKPEPFEIANVSKTAAGVSFEITKGKNSNAIAFVALYDENGLVEIKKVDTELKSYNVPFDKIKSATRGKIIIIDQSTMEPLCENIGF